MLPGLNQNIILGGATFHVQTEDAGGSTGVITTVVFKDGQVLDSEKSTYLPSAATASSAIAELMSKQHNRVISRFSKAATSTSHAQPKIGSDKELTDLVRRYLCS